MTNMPGSLSVAQEDFPLEGIESCRDLPPMSAPAEEAFDPELPEGTVLDGRFVIQARISRSRMSTIYRATDRDRDGARVAVKIPLIQVESDPIGFAEFQREALIGVQLKGPGLLRFFSVQRRTGRPYLVTEFLEGCTLADLMRRRRPLPERDALQIGLAVTRALAALHAAGFVHRDLKPANVVLGRDGRLTLIDFGQTRPIARQRGVLAALAPLIGTPEYIAPEQVEHRPVDERTDIYSLGAILYEMLTGVLPFPSGGDAWAAAYRRTTGDPPAPRQVNPALSLQAEEVVLRAMQRTPAARYPSATALAEDLRRPEAVRLAGLASQLRRPRWRLSFHGTPLLAGIAIGAVAVTGLIGLFLALIQLHPGR